MNTFWFGWLTAFCLMGVSQGMYGREAYLKMLSKHWINISSWFFVSVWLMGILYIVMKRLPKKE